MFGEVWTAKKYVTCWNIITYNNMDIKWLHPVWKEFLDTVNTVVLTRYWKPLIIVLLDIQCFFQSGSECGPWTKIIGNSCLIIQIINLDFFMILFICNVSQWWTIYWCALLRGQVSKHAPLLSVCLAGDWRTPAHQWLCRFHSVLWILGVWFMTTKDVWLMNEYRFHPIFLVVFFRYCVIVYVFKCFSEFWHLFWSWISYLIHFNIF